MPWGRWFTGHVRVEGLVHYLYTNGKDERIYWETSCGFVWGGRDNINHALQPRVLKVPVTCFECFAREWRYSGWSERTSTSRSAR